MKTIIITGAQGSGKTIKANELAKQYAYRKPFQKEITDAYIYEYPEEICKNDKQPCIITVQKQLLNELLNKLNHSNYTILDLDF